MRSIPVQARRVLAVVVVVVGMPAAAAAQRGSAATIADGVTALDPVRDARVAAGRRSVAANATAGFFGGLAMGFFGAFGLVAHGDAPSSGAVAGLAVLVAATEGGDTAPSPELARQAMRQGPAYERAFHDAHVARLRARRRRAGLLGALGGAGAGALALVWVLGHVD